jgi:hypothetical protein
VSNLRNNFFSRFVHFCALLSRCDPRGADVGKPLWVIICQLTEKIGMSKIYLAEPEEGRRKRKLTSMSWSVQKIGQLHHHVVRNDCGS